MKLAHGSLARNFARLDPGWRFALLAGADRAVRLLAGNAARGSA